MLTMLCSNYWKCLKKLDLRLWLCILIKTSSLLQFNQKEITAKSIRNCDSCLSLRRCRTPSNKHIFIPGEPKRSLVEKHLWKRIRFSPYWKFLWQLSGGKRQKNFPRGLRRENFEISVHVLVRCVYIGKRAETVENFKMITFGSLEISPTPD